MLSIRVLTSLGRVCPVKVRTISLFAKNFQQPRFVPKHPTSFSPKPQPKHDVVLYRYENPKFFITMNTMSALQCLFWSYIGYFLYYSVDKYKISFEGPGVMNMILRTEQKYSKILSIATIVFGVTVFIGTVFYSLRSIRKMILHGSNRYISIITYNFSGYNELKVPLSDISAVQSRAKAKKYVPLKIKNTNFYYLVDVRGEFPDPDLFDRTAGVMRSF